MEWTVLISPIVSALVAVFGAYQAVKREADERERKYAAAIARLETKIAQLETKVDLLSDRVEKHNNTIERTFRLESEVDNLYHRYDEVRNDIKCITKTGGVE